MRFMIILFALTILNQAHAGFYDDRGHGWYWYEQESMFDVDESPESIQSILKRRLTPREATAIANKIKEKNTDLKNLAVLQPTPENMKNLQDSQNQTFDTGRKFHRSWQKLLYAHPEIIKGNGVSNAARMIYNEEKSKKQFERLKVLSERVGFIFFYTPECPWCVKFSPIVKDFSDSLGFEVLPISKNGGVLPEWESTKRDNGLSTMFNVSTYPQLVAVDKITNNVVLKVPGFVTEDELIERLLTLTESIYR